LRTKRTPFSIGKKAKIKTRRISYYTVDFACSTKVKAVPIVHIANAVQQAAMLSIEEVRALSEPNKEFTEVHPLSY